MDVTNITPAPWMNDGEYILQNDRFGGRSVLGTMRHGTKDDVEFVTLARAAFDVQMKRGWTAIQKPGGVFVGVDSQNHEPQWCVPNVEWPNAVPFYPDPFSALVAADEWYSREIEGKR